jgi:hypothetical protein
MCAVSFLSPTVGGNPMREEEAEVGCLTCLRMVKTCVALVDIFINKVLQKPPKLIRDRREFLLPVESPSSFQFF